MTDFNEWPWVGEWKCAGCDASIDTRWKYWPDDKLWEFLTTCPICKSNVMTQHYKTPKLGFEGFKHVG